MKNKIKLQLLNSGKLTTLLTAVFSVLLCLISARIAVARIIDEAELEMPRVAGNLPLAPQRTAVGGIDLGFGASVTEGSSSALSLAVQPDGKFLVGGLYTGVGGAARGSLERFNADGTRDAAFNPGGAGANGSVYVILVLPDGKLMISGGMTAYNGASCLRICRLNANGTLDATFSVQGTSTNGTIQDMVFQTDGKILISGNFTAFNGITRTRVARLNADGTLDTTFNPNINGFTEEIVLQPDGKIFIGGAFTTVGGVGRRGVARLNADGTLDTAFNPGTGAGASGSGGSVFAAERQADGKFLIGGFFDNYNGTTRQNVARLNTDGSLDATFNPNTGGLGVEFFAVQPDGKIVVVGAMTASNFGCVRLNPDGATDSGFTAGTVDDFGYVVAIQADGKILVGGFFAQYAGQARANVARLNTNGAPDTFSAGISNDPIVRVITQQADGKILVGGQFRRANGSPRRNLARFNLDGTLDATFDPGSNFGGFNSPSVWSIAVQTDGRIMTGGNYSITLGNPRNFVTRLMANGALDNSFIYNDAINLVRDIEIQTDGKIILAGFFFNDLEQVNTGIVRLLSDGNYDPTIPDTFTGANSTVVEIELLPDGKAMIMGAFTAFNGTGRNRIARINPDATLDTTFNPGTGANSTVFDVAMLPNGQMYVGGQFTSFNGAANTNDIVRLNSNGTLDTSFNSGASGFNGNIFTLLTEPDGKILAGGNFYSYNGTPVNQLALLTAAGALDGSFNSPFDGSLTNFVYRLYRQTDAKILVGGGFVTPRNALLRLNSSNTAPRAPFDFDGDGKTDISIFRQSAGQWWLNRSAAGVVVANFGNSTDKIAPADYTGDGKTDIAVFRPSTGEWFVLRSEDSSYYALPFGISSDTPVPADYDGDGKADIAVFRSSDNTWYIQKSGGGTDIVNFGAAGDVPVPGDYDGDGKADVAIFRANGAIGAEWWVRRSTNGGVFVLQFGVSTDKPVQGDFTGDGKTDIAVWRPSTGVWFILRSEDNSFYSVPFGAAGDKPVPGDYDGDGKYDNAVFRPSENNWYVQRSTAGILIQAFGAAGDLAVPNAYIP